MPKPILKHLPLLLTTSLIFLAVPVGAHAQDSLTGIDLDLSAGYRVDQLDWNIAGNIAGTNPNILSELTWDNLESYQVTARGKAVMANHRHPIGGVVRGGISYGDIFSGENQDSDYFGDNRTAEFSRSNNNADDGEVWDVNLGGGIAFFMAGGKFSLTPLLGGSYHKQSLSISDGFQTLSDPGPHPEITLPPIGPIEGLDSSYEAEWRSGWLGLDLDYLPQPGLSLHGSLELHGGSYEATGNWNLRDDLRHPVSFKHTSSSAHGVVTNLGLRAGGERLQMNLDFYYQKWGVDDGEDRTYFSDGSVGITRLNEVNWEATSINAGITVCF